MEKLLGLLHEGTIVNLRVLFTIACRYKILVIFAMVLFCSLLSYNFFGQPLIYALTVPMKVETDHKISNDLSFLLPVDNTRNMSLDELNVSLSNYTFLKNLASAIIADPSFDKLNFGSLQSIKSFRGAQIKKECSENKECMVSQLADILRDFFYVEQGGTDLRFKLTVNAIDRDTTKVLGELLTKAIEEDRVRLRQLTVQKEINNVSKLIDESHSMMQKMGGNTVLQEQEKLQNDISDLRERIKMLQINESVEIANVSTLQAKLFENKKRTNRASDKEQFESLLKIQNRLNEIRQNIGFLTHTPEEQRTASDKLILSQLGEERARLIKTLPQEQRFRAMQLEEKFKDKQMENTGNVEFDYLVAKNKAAKLRQDYEVARKELDKLLQLKIANEAKINGMKADLDFLKGLEAKHMSLKLINATMTSDLLFEDGNEFIDEFRKSSFTKLAIFSFLISGFFYLIALVTKYSLDDKIYGEDDVRLYFKDLDFVGEVPSFD